MSLNRLHAILIGGWLVSIIAVLALGSTVGRPWTATDGLAIVVLACLPVLVLLRVFRGAPPSTITQVLYQAEQTTREQTRVSSTANHGVARQ